MLAWLYTGPLGHVAAGFADWVELLARYLRERLNRRRARTTPAR